MLRAFGDPVATRCDMLGIENRTIAHTRVQHFCTNPAKIPQHHVTSTNVAWKIWPFSNLSQQHPTCCNTLQHGGQTHSTCSDQTMATFQCNLFQHCWVQHVACGWLPCCDLLRHVGCCWLKFEIGQIFHATIVDVEWCCSRFARFVQQCCTHRFLHPTCRNKTQQGGKTHINAASNNAEIRCVEVLRSFGRSLQMLG